MGFLTDLLGSIPVNAVLRKEIEEWEKKHEELETENNQLKEENQELKSKLKELTSSDGLCEEEVNILQLLSSSEQKLTAGMIARILDLNPTRTEYYLIKMWRQYVYSHDYTNAKPSVYYLSQEGREYLVKNDLI